MSTTTTLDKNQPNPIPKAPRRIPYIDLTVPGTPVSSRYVIAWNAQQEREKEEKFEQFSDATNEKADISPGKPTSYSVPHTKESTVNEQVLGETKQNIPDQEHTKENTIDKSTDDSRPFEKFLSSIEKLKTDRLKNVDSKDILDLLLKLEHAARFREEIDNNGDDDDDDDGYRSVGNNHAYGYANAGKYNTGLTTNLSMFSLSYLRRRSLNQDFGGNYLYSPTLSVQNKRNSKETSPSEQPNAGMENFQSLRRSVSNLERYKELKRKYECKNRK